MWRWQHPYDRTSFPRLPFLLCLGLLFLIQIETTIVARAYVYLIGLNEKSTDALARGSDVLPIAMRAFCLLTILLPIIIWITSQPAPRRATLSSMTIRLGLWLWLGGALISTLAHSDNPLVIINFFAGIASAGAVFFAIRRLRLGNTTRPEWMFAAIALGAIVPAVQGIVGFYSAWGIPNAQALPQIHYETLTWQEVAPFGNPNHVGTMYCLLAAPCLVIVASGAFRKSFRWLAWILLLCAGLNVILSFARSSLVTLALAILFTAIFTRSKKALLLSAVVLILFLVLMIGGFSNHLAADFIGKAVRFDLADPSAYGRMAAMRESWQMFLDHPVYGVGAWQSPEYLGGWTAHQLAIWQAADYGVLAFMGVLVLTVGCIGRLAKVLILGATRIQLTMEFIFLLGPTMYFVKGLYADVNTNNTVVNTWICSAFAMLAIADTLAWAPSRAEESAMRTYVVSPRPSLASGR